MRIVFLMSSPRYYKVNNSVSLKKFKIEPNERHHAKVKVNDPEFTIVHRYIYVAMTTANE